VGTATRALELDRLRQDAGLTRLPQDSARPSSPHISADLRLTSAHRTRAPNAPITAGPRAHIGTSVLALLDTERRFGAPVDRWLPRRSVGLKGEHGQPGTGNLRASVRALHSFPMSGAIWLLPVFGYAAMMAVCAWLMWRMFRPTPRQDG